MPLMLFRVAVLTLALCAPAHAYAPLICDIPGERLAIRGDRAIYKTQSNKTWVFTLANHRKEHGTDVWDVHGDGEHPSNLQIKNRRTMLWLFGNSGGIRGVCR